VVREVHGQRCADVSVETTVPGSTAVAVRVEAVRGTNTEDRYWLPLGIATDQVHLKFQAFLRLPPLAALDQSDPKVSGSFVFDTGSTQRTTTIH